MFVVFGERKFGKVDRVPGVCYVVTVFAHLNFIPLLPLRSYAVVEGSETGDEFRGKHLGLSLKSVFVGYARAWGGMVILFCGMIACVELFGNDQRAASPEAAKILVPVAGLLIALCLFVPGKAGYGLQAAAHLVSGVVYFLYESTPGRDFLLADNVMLLAYGLLRLCDYAGSTKRRKLMEQLGIEVPPEDNDPRHPDDRWEQWDGADDRKGS